jgi:hypothetical protein
MASDISNASSRSKFLKIYICLMGLELEAVVEPGRPTDRLLPLKKKSIIRFNVESGRSWVLTASATTSSLLHVDNQKRLYCRSTDGDAEPKDYYFHY